MWCTNIKASNHHKNGFIQQPPTTATTKIIPLHPRLIDWSIRVKVSAQTESPSRVFKETLCLANDY